MISLWRSSNSIIPLNSRTKDQMEQAARSGKQNIAEGSQISRTSKKSELKLLNVSRSSLQELLEDYENYLRQHNLSVWDRNGPQARKVRSLAYMSYRTYKSYKTFSSGKDFLCILAGLTKRSSSDRIC